jgi:hypothetical protein
MRTRVEATGRSRGRTCPCGGVLASRLDEWSCQVCGAPCCPRCAFTPEAATFCSRCAGSAPATDRPAGSQPAGSRPAWSPSDRVWAGHLQLNGAGRDGS